MKLITEDMPEVEPVSEKSIDEVLSTDAFGKFAVLSASEEEFVALLAVGIRRMSVLSS